MRLLFFLVVGMGLSTVAVAADSNLCEEMAQYSCKPGTYSDGTGSITRTTDKAQPRGLSKQFQDALDKETRTLQLNFQNYLKDPNNVYFKKIAIAALGLNDSADCQSENKVAQCNAKVVEGLVHLARKRISGDFAPAADGTPKRLDLGSAKYIINDDGFKSIADESSRRLSVGNVDPERLKNIRDKMFPQIKALLVKKVSELPIDETQKKNMVDKIKGIRFGNGDCSDYAPGAAEAYVPNASYSPTEQSFTVCKGFLASGRSDFNMAMIMGHELSHSIDPCHISYGPEGVGLNYSSNQGIKKMETEYPIKGLLTCLRSEKSAHAQRYAAPQETDEFCDGGDQINESVADWFGDDIMAEYISKNYPELTQAQWREGVANVFRPMCMEGGYPEFNEHPTTERRVDAVLLVNPKVRAQMGCTKPQSKYVNCDAQNSDAMAIASPRAGGSSAPSSNSNGGVK